MPKLSDEIGKLAAKYEQTRRATGSISKAEPSLRQVGREMASRWSNPGMEAGLESEVFTEPLSNYFDTKWGSDGIAGFAGHTLASLVPKTRSDVIRMGATVSKLGALKGTNPEKMLSTLKAKGIAQDLAKRGGEISRGMWDKIVGRAEGPALTGAQRAAQGVLNQVPVLMPSTYSMNRSPIEEFLGIAGRVNDGPRRFGGLR